MAKKSLHQVNLEEAFLRQSRWRNRLKSPYRCPVCFLERAVHVKKEKLKRITEADGRKKFITEYKFHIYCQHGCFRTSFTYTSELSEPVDAYCDLIDNILKEKEVKNS